MDTLTSVLSPVLDFVAFSLTREMTMVLAALLAVAIIALLMTKGPFSRWVAPLIGFGSAWTAVITLKMGAILANLTDPRWLDEDEAISKPEISSPDLPDVPLAGSLTKGLEGFLGEQAEGLNAYIGMSVDVLNGALASRAALEEFGFYAPLLLLGVAVMFFGFMLSLFVRKPVHPEVDKLKQENVALRKRIVDIEKFNVRTRDDIAAFVALITASAPEEELQAYFQKRQSDEEASRQK